MLVNTVFRCAFEFVGRAALALVVLLSVLSTGDDVHAADTISARKFATGGAGCGVEESGTFTITTTQTIEWSATVVGSASCGNGDNFYLNANNGGILRDITSPP